MPLEIVCVVGRQRFDVLHPTCRSCRVGSCSLRPTRTAAPDEEGQEPLEDMEQLALAAWLDQNLGPHDWSHVPNGGHRLRGVAGRLKAHGVKRGVPDVVVIRPPPSNPEARGVVLELKRRRRGRVSSEQQHWLESFREYGWLTATCRGADEAIRFLRDVCGYADQVNYPPPIHGLGGACETTS